MRVAFYVYPAAFQNPAGGEVQLLKTKEHLEKLGVSVKLFDPWTDKLASFDILHTFGSVKDCLPIMRAAHDRGVKNALSTICWYSLKAAWGNYDNIADRALYAIRYMTKVVFPRFPSKRRIMMELSDVLLPNSASEARQVSRLFAVPMSKMRVVPNGVDGRFLKADRMLFVKKFNVSDFVLCVGRIEPRKNQLTLIRALKKETVPLVFIGGCEPQNANYYADCKREASKNTLFIENLPHDSDLLSAAYAACNTFILPSWHETTGLVGLEAGLAGAKVLMTQEGATRDYFQDFVSYVDPAFISDIRAKTLKSFSADKDDRLRQHIVKNYLWETVAQKTLEVYQELLKRGDSE